MNNNDNAFVTEFKANVKFSYSCFDRVILRGYIRKLFVAGAVVNFLRALGFEKLSQAVLRILTDQLTKHIKKVAERYHIPVIWWESLKGTEKEKLKYVERHYGRKYKGKGNFVFCIIIAREKVRTFGSKELESRNGEKYHKLYNCNKFVNHFYIYCHDEVLGGPCYLKICSYLPFPCEFYFNGHNVIKLELTKRGIKYKMEDNAFTWIENPDVLEKIAQSLKGKTVLKRINYWMDRFFKFDKGDRIVRPKGLEHEWYVSQVEVCTNVIFKSARFCTRLFERLLDKFTRFGLPDRISQIFGKRPRRSNSKSTWRVYDNNACVRFWFRKNSVKMYNKNGKFIRVETTINNPKSLGHKLEKKAIFLQAYFWFALSCNNRFYECCADIDITSIADGEAEKFSKPVCTPKGKRVAAPDLRKDRQYALLRELLKPKYLAFGFRMSDLLNALSGYFRNCAEIRYELNKLKVRGVIVKKKGQNFYRITQEGWKWLWIQICSTTHFQEPMVAKIFKDQAEEGFAQSSQIEQAYSLINQGLSLFFQEVAMAS